MLSLVWINRTSAQGSFVKPAIRQDSRTVFGHFSTTQGMSNPEVISIFQDRYGYYWFGTMNGLNKFDGYGFTIFRNDPFDSTSLSSDVIECIGEDPLGNLWIGTEEGLNKYIREKNRFERYRFRPVDTVSRAGKHIRAILFDKDTILWLETMEGMLYKINLMTRAMKSFPHAIPYQPEYHYHIIYDDKQGNLWLGGREMGIIRFNKHDETFTQFSIDPENPLKKRERDVSCYFMDSYGNFWISGFDGAYIFDPEKAEFRRFLSTSTWSITEDAKRFIWFGTGDGAYRYDPRDTVIVQYRHEPDNQNAISGNSVNKIMVDRTGTIWLGTNHGLNRIAKKRYPFENYSHVVGNAGTISSDRVSCILQGGDGKVWIGTMGYGLNCFDPAEETFRVFRYDGKKTNGLASDKISCLYEDKHGELWVGLWAGIGFQRFNPKTGIFRKYCFDKSNLKADWYNDFAEDNEGYFYLGFWGGPGLTLFDRQTGTFTSIRERLKPVFQSRLINELYTDSKGMLWIGTSTTGLHRYDPVKKTSVKINLTAPNDTLPGSEPVVHCLLEDKTGNLWVGTKKGMYMIPPGAGKIVHYSSKEGLCDNGVMGMEMDNSGNIWIGTRNGLSKFIPFAKKFTSFNVFDGLPGNSFTRAHARLKSGQLLFGGNNGFTMFFPDSIFQNPISSHLVIQNFIVKGEERIADLGDTREITLEYHENSFSFSFASPDHIAPLAVKYAYKLESFEENWTVVEATSRKASYTNVPPGTYNFLVRMVGHSDGLLTREAKVGLVILPPFWQRWWFYLFILFSVIGLLFWLIRSREQRIVARHRAVELKQKLLRLQMNPHFIFNSLFAIQSYIYDHKTDEAGRYLSEFAHLIRLILSNSREEFIPLEKELETLKLYLHLQELRFEHKFDFHLEIDPEIAIELIAIPPMLAQPFIENALEHGFRGKPGRGSLRISFMLRDEKIRFEVADDGIGIKKALEIKDNQKGGHESMAVKITRERLNMLNRNRREKIILEILDVSLVDPGKQGTIVRFDIPFLEMMPVVHDSNQ